MTAATITRTCACGHDEGQHHPAGRCTAGLPAAVELELPAWSCPCREFVGEEPAPSRDVIACHLHPAYWRQGCGTCQEARALTLALRSVQSCTVHAEPHSADQDVPGVVPVPRGTRPGVLWRVATSAADPTRSHVPVTPGRWPAP